MKRNLLRRAMAFTLGLGVACSLFACTNNSNPDGNNIVINDGKTVNVRVYNAGYGTSYIGALAEKFNEAYKEEGYRVNVLAPQEDLGSTILLQDIYNKSGIDLYFCSCDIGLGVEGPYGSMLENITDMVLNRSPIRFDGTEEEGTVLEKLNGMKLDIEHEGKYYAIPYAYGFGGMAVNTRVLTEYELSIPRTTNELFDCVDKLMEKAATTRVFPVTYSSGGVYPNTLIRAWMAQYSGKEYIEQFWSMLNEDGSRMEKPYDVFADESIERALAEFYRLYDYNAVADGAAMQTFTAAQAQLMRGDAAFYAVGDWMFNEEFDRFPQQRNDVTIINTPVISALGVKLFGDTYDEAKCDQILSQICKYIDEYKTMEEIETLVESDLSVSLDMEEIERVCEARGYTDPMSSSMIFLSVNSQVKDIAALFMRMCASTEGGTLIAEHTRSNNPFSPNALANKEYRWLQDASKILANPYSDYFRTGMVMTDYRATLSVNSMFPLLGSSIVAYVSEEGKTIYSGFNLDKTGDLALYASAAQTTAQAIYTHAKKQYDEKIWNVHL